MKECRKCNTEYPLDLFYKDKGAKDGHRNICKPCTINNNSTRAKKLSSSKLKEYRDTFKEKHGITKLKAYSKKSRIKRKYGLSVDEYLDHIETPCDICGEDSEHLDHCHKSGKARGGLCRSCNWMLGNAKDKIEILNKAIDYLKEHNNG